MLVLNRDRAFQYELLRVLGTSHDRGADVGEVLRIAPKIIPGDFESWHEQFRFNVPTFEGPGQPAVLRQQGLGFIAEWEPVVPPVVNQCERLACVDTSRIALLGYSFGGFLAPRAAAFEHRLAAVVCVDGLSDIK